MDRDERGKVWKPYETTGKESESKGVSEEETLKQRKGKLRQKGEPLKIC